MIEETLYDNEAERSSIKQRRWNLKVALVAPYFLPFVGGIETYIYELAKRFSERGIEVYVFTSGKGTVIDFEKIRVFRFRALDFNDLPSPLKIPYPIPLSLLFKLTRINVDIIHVHGHAFFSSFAGALASRLNNKPLVLTIHDIGVAYRDYTLIRGVRPIMDSTMVKFIFKRANIVISQNEATYNYAAKFGPKRIIAIPQAVDLDKFKPKKDGEYVTFLAARLVPQKGCEVFVRAIPKVTKDFGETRFMVIGDGVQRSYLEKLVHDLGVEDYVDFVGGIPYKSVPKYLSQAKIVVFPSEIPTGLALLEAAAMKKAIITTKNSWAKDVLGDTPIFVPSGDSYETARAITYLLRNPDERKRIAELAYKKVVSERDWDTVALEHVRLYEGIVRRKKRASG